MQSYLPGAQPRRVEPYEWSGRSVQRAGNGSPGITADWSMQEILPKTVVPLTSPAAAAGELSRRSRSELAVQNTAPFKTGLVGNSRIWLFPTLGSAELRRPEALTGFRTTSKT